MGQSWGMDDREQGGVGMSGALGALDAMAGVGSGAAAVSAKRGGDGDGDGNRDAEGSDDGEWCPPCAICGHSGRGPCAPRHLTHGVVVWLCRAHGNDGFMGKRYGLEFVERLAAAWVACGVSTARRRAALHAHVRRIRSAGTPRSRPGSYSWPVLRREAERRFAAGEPPNQVIAELRRDHRDGPAMVPSVRTMRRWFSQARWLMQPSPPPIGREHKTDSWHGKRVGNLTGGALQNPFWPMWGPMRL